MTRCRIASRLLDAGARLALAGAALLTAVPAYQVIAGTAWPLPWLGQALGLLAALAALAPALLGWTGGLAVAGGLYLAAAAGGRPPSPWVFAVLALAGSGLSSAAARCRGKGDGPRVGLSCGASCKAWWAAYELLALAGLALAAAGGLGVERVLGAVARLSAVLPPDTAPVIRLLAESPTAMALAALLVLAALWVFYTSYYPLLYALAATPRSALETAREHVARSLGEIRRGRAWHIRLHAASGAYLGGEAFALSSYSTYALLSRSPLGTGGALLAGIVGSLAFYFVVKRLLSRWTPWRAILAILLVVGPPLALAALSGGSEALASGVLGPLTGRPPAPGPADDRLSTVERFFRALEYVMRVALH